MYDKYNRYQKLYVLFHNELRYNYLDKTIIMIQNQGCILQNKNYSKTCVKWPLSKSPKIVFKTNYRLMQVKSSAECSKGSILQ